MIARDAAETAGTMQTVAHSGAALDLPARGCLLAGGGQCGALTFGRA